MLTNNYKIWTGRSALAPTCVAYFPYLRELLRGRAHMFSPGLVGEPAPPGLLSPPRKQVAASVLLLAALDRYALTATLDPIAMRRIDRVMAALLAATALSIWV